MGNLRNLAYNWLRRSEAFFKSDMVYLAKSGFWLSVSQIVAMAAGFILSITFAHLFEKESFGNYKFIISMVAIIGSFSLTGMSTALTQAVAQGQGSLVRAFILNLKWSFGVFISGLGISIYYYLQGNELLFYSFLLAAIVYPFTLSAGLYGAYLVGKKDFRRNSYYNIINNTLPAISMIMALYLSANTLVIIIVYLLSGALVPLFLYFLTVRHYRADQEVQSDSELMSYSGHLSAMEVIGRIVSLLDRILIFHYLGAAPLAIYAFAISPVEQLQSGKKILSTIIMPKLTERPFEELQKSAPRKALLLTIYALVLAGIYILFAPLFYKTFFPQYLDSVIYSQIYAFTLLAISGTVFNETLTAHKRKRELYIHRTTIPIVQVILFFILLPILGLMGLVIAHVIMRIFSSLFSYYLVEHPLAPVTDIGVDSRSA